MKKGKKLLVSLLAVLSTACLAIGFGGCEITPAPTPEAHTHDWGEWTILIQPTCTTSGLEKRICKTDSTHSEDRFISPAHDLVTHEEKTPTCTEIGWNAYETCENCDYTTYVEIKANGHNFVDGICSCGNANYEEFLVYELNEDGESYSVGFFTEESFMELVDNLYNSGIDFETEAEMYAYARSITPVLQLTAPLVIPSTYNDLPVTTIGDYAFPLALFKSVTIPDSVTSIGENAFLYCTSLTSVTIGNSVTSIGCWAFSYCYSLTSVTIGNSVTSIDDRAFYYCTSLTNIEVDKNNEYYQSIDGNLYNKDCTTLIQYAIGKTDTSFTIPDSVTSIGDRAFYSCTNLTSVTIGNSVTSIGNYAFGCCDNLTSVTIGNSVTSIGALAFSWCDSLTSVTFKNPNGWWYAYSSTATSGTSISATDLANPETAATYLKSTYSWYYWFRD